MDNNIQSRGFRCKPTKDCIKYIESFGLTINDENPQLTIPNLAGLVYQLPNNEVVLLSTALPEDFIGFIFDDMDAFSSMRKSGNFEIPTEYVEIWELEKPRLSNPATSASYYNLFLQELSGIGIEKIDKAVLERLHQFVNQYVAEQYPALIKDKVTIGYAVLLMNFMVSKNQMKWSFEEQFTYYNIYNYPALIDDSGECIDVISEVYTSLEKEGGGFRELCIVCGLSN